MHGIDIHCAVHELCGRQMPRHLHRLIALCLALVWGPVTMCCALEAAGLEVFCSDETCHSDGAATPPSHGCSVVESGKYQASAPTTKAAPSALFICACLAELRADIAEPDNRRFGVAQRESPQDWIVRWQFVRRAAALAHAPDSLIA